MEFGLNQVSSFTYLNIFVEQGMILHLSVTVNKQTDVIVLLNSGYLCCILSFTLIVQSVRRTAVISHETTDLSSESVIGNCRLATDSL